MRTAHITSSLAEWLARKKPDLEREGFLVTITQQPYSDEPWEIFVGSEVSNGTKWLQIFCWEKGDFEVHSAPAQKPTPEEYRVDYQRTSTGEQAIELARRHLTELTRIDLTG